MIGRRALQAKLKAIIDAIGTDTLAFFAGLSLVAYGCRAYSRPLGAIVFGAGLILIALFPYLRSPR